MKGCEWQVWLSTIESEVDAKLKDINKRIKNVSSIDNIKVIKTWLRKVQKEVTKKVASAYNAEDSGCAEQLRVEASSVWVQEDTIQDELQEQVTTTDLCYLNLIHAALKDLLSVLKVRPT